MELIDTHCHLDACFRAGRLNTVLTTAQEHHVNRIIAVGTDSQDWNLYHDISQAHQGQIDYTVGLHPCHVDENWETQVTQVADFFTKTVRPIALGEIGLDYFRLPKDALLAEAVVEHQKSAFRSQLVLAKQLALPIVIHSRAAFEDTITILDDSGVNWQQVVFHCFSGDDHQVRLLNARGGRASFTGIITYKNAESMRLALKAQGIERLMLETDAPYLAPVPHRGSENEPAWVYHIAKMCAQILELDLETLATKTTENAQNFFKL